MEIKDEEIIDGILKKDKYALTKLINKYGTIIHNTIFFILKDDYESINECEDDVLMCLWKNIDCFSKEKGNFKWWIVAIAKNKALTYNKRSVKSNNNIDIDNVKIKLNYDIEADYLKGEKKKQVINLIKGNLKEEDSEIFIRRYFMDDSIREIAKHMNVTSITVYNRLSRGRRKLKKILKEQNINFE